MVVLEREACDSRDLLLGERVTSRTLDLYRTTFGSIDTLLADLGLPADPSSLGQADLARLNGRAVNHLAAQDACNRGRAPLRPADWRTIRYCLSGPGTLRDAIVRCIDCFEAIDWRCGRMSLRTRAGLAEVGLDAMRRERDEGSCLIDLCGVAQIHALLGWLIARPLPLSGIWLDYNPAMFAGLGIAPLPYSVNFDQGWTGFAFPLSFLDYPVVRAEKEFEASPPGSFLFYQPLSAEGREPASGRVRRLAMSALRERQRLPAFAELVAVVGVSSATLRRMLAEEGTSYREIRDSCRRELALDLLRRPNLSIEEIAAMLDYCDSDAFRRAFRDWVGVPPSQYRRDTMAELQGE
jgi:AraC-like DNA-binding protein